jgi:alkanesulfonate monooxygenase SsuD/methylene tetrahydromethanopterin reductase-like flavin-dependent oxidoreductase (luciferase family)
MRLLALATAAPYRHAGLLAKIVTTLDVLSGGRAMLAIGAGDNEDEAEGLGLSYPSLGERFELLEDTVQACLRMWDGETGDQRPFLGKHLRMDRPLNVPQSLSRPHPPILIRWRWRGTHTAIGRPLCRRLQHSSFARTSAKTRGAQPPL